MQHTGRDKSFVYDLTIEPGTVRVRVASVPRSTEVQPGFVRFDTFHHLPTTTTPFILCCHTLHSYSACPTLCYRSFSHSLACLPACILPLTLSSNDCSTLAMTSPLTLSHSSSVYLLSPLHFIHSSIHSSYTHTMQPSCHTNTYATLIFLIFTKSFPRVNFQGVISHPILSHPSIVSLVGLICDYCDCLLPLSPFHFTLSPFHYFSFTKNVSHQSQVRIAYSSSATWHVLSHSTTRHHCCHHCTTPLSHFSHLTTFCAAVPYIICCCSSRSPL